MLKKYLVNISMLSMFLWTYKMTLTNISHCIELGLYIKEKKKTSSIFMTLLKLIVCNIWMLFLFVCNAFLSETWVFCANETCLNAQQGLQVLTSRIKIACVACFMLCCYNLFAYLLFQKLYYFMFYYSLCYLSTFIYYSFARMYFFFLVLLVFNYSVFQMFSFLQFYF